MVVVAATADLHVNAKSRGRLGPELRAAVDGASLLLIGGDLTSLGTEAEAELLAAELDGLGVPCLAVLGNHDHHADAQVHLVAALAAVGVAVLDGTACSFDIDGHSVGVAGAKGFGGGFPGASGSAFGERAMKDFMEETAREGARLRTALDSLQTSIRIALLHYSPTPDTLVGERLEIYPFLGSGLLGDAVDAAGADVVFHGHAHAGTLQGRTRGGIDVRNVARPLLGREVATRFEIGVGGRVERLAPDPDRAQLVHVGGPRWPT